MNRTELIKKIASKSDLSQKQIAFVIADYENIIVEQLIKGDKVSLSGFGTFETVSRAEREGRNPKTGETIMIQASKAPKFKPFAAFKDAVNA